MIGPALDVFFSRGDDAIATVYVGRFPDGREVEFVESVQPPRPREDKWVVIVSSLFGCPVRCVMCDAGGSFRGRLTAEQILAQIDHVVLRRYPSGEIPARRFKVQFARVGEPAFNPAVPDALAALPARYRAPGLVACVSTVAPAASDGFFERLRDVKERLYRGRFQLQFSIHSTDPGERDTIIPVSKWSLGRIAGYGEEWWRPGDMKITLNFAAREGAALDPALLAATFDPRLFLVKLTPLNPTRAVAAGGLRTLVDPEEPDRARSLVDAIRGAGFEVIVSVGDLEENRIGSNCGMYLTGGGERPAAC